MRSCTPAWAFVRGHVRGRVHVFPSLGVVADGSGYPCYASLWMDTTKPRWGRRLALWIPAIVALGLLGDAVEPMMPVWLSLAAGGVIFGVGYLASLAKAPWWRQDLWRLAGLGGVCLSGDHGLSAALWMAVVATATIALIVGTDVWIHCRRSAARS